MQRYFRQRCRCPVPKNDGCRNPSCWLLRSGFYVTDLIDAPTNKQKYLFFSCAFHFSEESTQGSHQSTNHQREYPKFRFQKVGTAGIPRRYCQRRQQIPTYHCLTTQSRLLNGPKWACPVDLHGPNRTTGPFCNIHRQSAQTAHIHRPIRQNMHHRVQRLHESFTRTIICSIKHRRQICPLIPLDKLQHIVRIHHATIFGPSRPVVAELVLTLRVGTPVYCCAVSGL